MEQKLKRLTPDPDRPGLASVADLYLASDLDVHRIDRERLESSLGDESLPDFLKVIVQTLLARSKPEGTEG